VVSNAWGVVTSQVAAVTVAPTIMITCPSNLTVNADAGQCQATGVVLGTPETGGNPNVTNDAPAQFPLGTTTVTWTVTDVASNTATCQQFVTVLGNLPAITAQPQSQTNLAGSTANFSVTATSCSALSYQWQFHATNLDGATGAGLSVANVQAGQAGEYQVIVSNTAGAVTSAVATLTVLEPPAIVQGPTNRTIVLGAGAAFGVTASGTAPLGYQWWFNQTNLLSGATDASLELTSVQVGQAGTYHVVVTNAAGVATSGEATLAVITSEQVKLEAAMLPNGTNGPVLIQFNGVAGMSYTVQYRNALESGSWQSLTNVAPLGANQMVTAEDGLAGGVPQRFYRIVAPMQP
jgi:hypothetical protein